MGTQFVQIVRSQADYIPRTNLYHKVWLGLEDYVRIQYYDYNLNYYDLDITKHGIVLIESSFIVHRDLFERTAKHLIGINVNKFSLSCI